jgi:hypothetical protein
VTLPPARIIAIPPSAEEYPTFPSTNNSETLQFRLDGIWADYVTAMGSSTFNVYVNSAVASQAVAAQVKYDWTGDGTWDRTETYDYIALDDLTPTFQCKQKKQIFFLFFFLSCWFF